MSTDPKHQESRAEKLQRAVDRAHRAQEPRRTRASTLLSYTRSLLKGIRDVLAGRRDEGGDDG